MCFLFAEAPRPSRLCNVHHSSGCFIIDKVCCNKYFHNKIILLWRKLLLGLFAEVCAEAAHFIFLISGGFRPFAGLFALGMGTSFSWCKFGVAELYFLLLELLGLSCAVDPAPLDDTRSMLLSLGSGGLGHVAGWVPNKVGSQAVLHLVGKHFLP